MKNLRCFLAALALALFLSIAAAAGDIQGVGLTCPGDIQGVGCSAPKPVNEQTPGKSTQASAVDTGFNVSIGARVIAELLSIIF